MSVRFSLDDDKGTVTTFVELDASRNLFTGSCDIVGTFQQLEKGNGLGKTNRIFGVYVDGKITMGSSETINDELAKIRNAIAKNTFSATLEGRELKILTKK